MLEWKNVCIDVPNKNKNIKEKHINLVNNLTGHCKKGELMAIMGPSGCGKTTFLGCLAGRMQKGSKTTGEVTYDGKERDARDWLDKTGFVLQDDQIYEKLNVYETLEYAAKFKLKNANKINIEERIEELIKAFKISHIIKNRMEKLSGGERKRVMLALELITDPEVLFMDEPTSGLDATTALTVVKTLKELTLKGKTVIISIHQPGQELFQLFDSLLLMTDAKTIYFGQASLCEEFLAKKNIIKRSTASFPDFLTELAEKETIVDGTRPYHNEVLSLISDNQSTKTVNQTIITKNEDFRDFSINFRKVFIIAGRQLRLMYKNKPKFYKGFIIQLVIFLFFNLYVGFIVPWSYKNSDIYKNIMDNTNDEQFNRILNYFTRRDLLFTYFFFTCAVFFLKCSSAFSKNIEVVQREISAHSYSTATYFVGTCLVQIVLSTFWPILQTLSAIIFFRYIDLYSIALFFIKTFTIVILGVSLGAYFKSQIMLKFIGIFIYGVWVLSGLQDAGLKYCFMQKNQFLVTAIKFASWLNIILPLNATSNLFSYLKMKISFKNLNAEIKQNYIPANCYDELYNYFSVDALAVIYDFRLSNFTITSFALLSLLGFLLLALYVQASNLMPSVRMKLGNKQ